MALSTSKLKPLLLPKEALFRVLLIAMLSLISAIAQTRESGERAQRKLYEKILRDFPVSSNARKLDFLFSFPPNEDLKHDSGLWGARNIEIDDNGLIYLSDSKAHRILVFDSSGKYVRQIGKKGQAPGELMSPRGILCAGKSLIINDAGNHRFQFFDMAGKFRKSFPVYKTYYEIAGSIGGQIFAAPIRTDSSEPLVDVLDHEGRIRYSFGVGKTYINWSQLNWLKISTTADTVFLAYQYLPIIQKYSIAGALVGEYNVGHGFMKVQEKMNIARDREKNSREGGFINIVQAIRSDNGKVLIFVSHPRDEILEFDVNGRLSNFRWADKAYNSMDIAFAFDARFPKKRFCLLRVYPDNCVRVFEQNE